MGSGTKTLAVEQLCTMEAKTAEKYLGAIILDVPRAYPNMCVPSVLDSTLKKNGGK